MEDDRLDTQADIHEEVDAIILAHPRNHLDIIVKMICGKFVGSFVLLNVKQDIISFCQGAGIIEITINQIIDSFDVFRHEVTVARLVRGRVLPCVARRNLLLLHIRFCYNLAIMLLVRSEKLLIDMTSIRTSMRSRRSFDQLLNLDLSDEEEPLERLTNWHEPLEVVTDQNEPLETITVEGPQIHILQALEEFGASRMYLLPEDEPMRPVELEEEPMFGMPAELIWDTDAVINWLDEDLRPSSLFGPEQARPVEPEQARGAPAAPMPAEEPEPERAPPRPRRPRRAAADDALNRISTVNHLERFIKTVLRKRRRERDLEFNNHLMMLENIQEDVDPRNIPTEKRPCPFDLQEVQEMVAQFADENLPEFTIDDQLLGVSNITMATNLSQEIGNILMTPDVQGIPQQLGDVPLQPDTEMVPTFIEHILPDDAGILPVLPENVAKDPLPVIQTPQPLEPLTIQPENANAVDDPMQGIQEQQDHVGPIIQNLFEEPENAAMTVSVLIGENSIVHTLPTLQVIEQEPVLPEDNIAGRLRPVRRRRRRRLEFEGSPPSPPPRRRRRRRRQPRAADVDAAVAVGNAAPQHHYDDDLEVMPLPQLVPAEGFGRTFLDTPKDIRKNKFIEKLKELKNEHGNLINFLQICPFESTLRAEAAAVFGILIELCSSKQIELIQEVAYAPDKLFIKINF